MPRLLVALWTTVYAAGCVNLERPDRIAECSAKGSCVNNLSPFDGGDANGDTGPGAGSKLGQPPSADAARDLSERRVLDMPDASRDGAGIAENADSRNRPNGNQEVPAASDYSPGAASDARVASAPDGATGTCVWGGVFLTAGTVCRAAVGGCDIEETCDGVANDCPSDKLAAAGKECPTSVDDCGIAQTCSGTSPVCPSASATPAGACNRIIIYRDALENGWSNHSWNGAYTFDDPFSAQSSSASIAIRYTAPWGGLQLDHATAVSCAGKTAFTFWGHGGENGTRMVRFYVRSWSSAASTYKVLNIPSGTWTKFTVPLADVGSPHDVASITLQDGTGAMQPAFHIDQIEID